MRLEIRLHMNNAAFKDYPHEASRILRKLADRLEPLDLSVEGTNIPLYDLRGVSTGFWIITGLPDES